jgi:glutamate-1-semialdehyde 2,1-aminomutase
MDKPALYNQAKQYMVGGVSAGGRYHPALKRPLFLESAVGSRLIDIEGNEWIDYHSSSGSAFLGYNHPEIKKALEACIEKGFFLNFETEYHAELASLICDMVPSAQKVRICNSGTEATLAAIRVARAHTGKDKIIKFEGHFHGMHEFVFYNWHSHLGKQTENGTVRPVQDTAGIPGIMDDLLIVIPFNDIEIFKKTVAAHKDELAGVIMEPVMYNAGCMEPHPDYLKQIREVTAENNIVLIYDEVLSGFRMCKGGAQEHYGVLPDLTALAKAVGSGMGIAALAGKTEIMSNLNPEGPVIMSGTYSGSLLPVMGALAALKVLNRPGFYEELNKKADYFYQGINKLFAKSGLKGLVQGLGARFGLYFGCDKKVHDFREAAAAYNLKAGKRFIQLAVENFLYFHDYGDSIVPMHCGFTAAHTYEDFDKTLEIMERIFSQMKMEETNA